jgi:hypothetical protein
MKNDLKIEDFLQHISDIYKHTLERSSTSAKARTPKRVEMGNTREGEDIVRSVRRRTAAKAVKD